MKRLVLFIVCIIRSLLIQATDQAMFMCTLEHSKSKKNTILFNDLNVFKTHLKDSHFMMLLTDDVVSREAVLYKKYMIFKIKSFLNYDGVQVKVTYYQCPQYTCTQKSRNKDDIIRHILLAHTLSQAHGNNMSCSICNKSCLDKKLLDAHIRMYHYDIIVNKQIYKSSIHGMVEVKGSIPYEDRGLGVTYYQCTDEECQKIFIRQIEAIKHIKSKKCNNIITQDDSAKEILDKPVIIGQDNVQDNVQEKALKPLSNHNNYAGYRSIDDTVFCHVCSFSIQKNMFDVHCFNEHTYDFCKNLYI